MRKKTCEAIRNELLQNYREDPESKLMDKKGTPKLESSGRKDNIYEVRRDMVRDGVLLQIGREYHVVECKLVPRLLLKRWIEDIRQKRMVHQACSEIRELLRMVRCENSHFDGSYIHAPYYGKLWLLFWDILKRKPDPADDDTIEVLRLLHDAVNHLILHGEQLKVNLNMIAAGLGKAEVEQLVLNKIRKPENWIQEMKKQALVSEDSKMIDLLIQGAVDFGASKDVILSFIEEILAGRDWSQSEVLSTIRRYLFKACNDDRHKVQLKLLEWIKNESQTLATNAEKIIPIV